MDKLLLIYYYNNYYFIILRVIHKNFQCSSWGQDLDLRGKGHENLSSKPRPGLEDYITDSRLAIAHRSYFLMVEKLRESWLLLSSNNN